ncbi:MAG: Fic family protein [Lachnospiraceae bacterium]|nr:Fic family protein [Lachnospiraceae bacterium]
METISILKYKSNAGIPNAKEELNERLKYRKDLPLRGIEGERICLTGMEEIEKKVASVRALYEKVPSKHRVQALIMIDAHSSATIEGAHTTVDKVKKCFDNPQSKDDKMVVNAVHGCNYAYNHCISADNIRVLWEIITKDVCENQDKAGTLYRNGMVYIGNDMETIHIPCSPEKLPEVMADLFAFQQIQMDEILKSIIFHFYFVYVHPFCDGNGRTARAVQGSQLFHAGLKKIKGVAISSAINDNLHGYYKAIKDSEERIDDVDENEIWLDVSPFVDYMLKVMETAMLNAILSENADGKTGNGEGKRGSCLHAEA